MKLTGRSLAINSIGYIFSNFLNRLIPFLVLPVLTFYLSTSELGVVSLYQSLVQFLVPLIGLGLAGIVSVEFVRKTQLEISSMVSESVMFFVISTIFFIILVYIYSEELTEYLMVSSFYLYLLPILAFSMSLINLFIILVQMKQKVLVFSLTKILISVVELFLLWVFVVVCLQGEIGRLQSIIYANVAASIAVFIIIFRKGGFGCIRSTGELYCFLRNASPLMVYELCFLLVLLTDKLFVRQLSGFDQVGVYMVGLQIGMVIGLLESSVIRAWIPWFFTTLNKGTKEGKIAIARFTYVYIFLLLIATCLWVPLSKIFLISLVDPSFHDGLTVLPWVAATFFFVGVYKVFAQYLFYEKSTLVLMSVSIFVAVINVPITWALVKSNGIVGAAQATFISYILASVITFFVSQRRYDIPFFDTNILTKSALK